MNRLITSARKTVALVLAVSISGFAVVQNVDPKKGRVTTNPTSGNSYTIEQEVDYGRKAIPEIEKEVPILPQDHPTSKFIDALGHRLAAKAPGYKCWQHFWPDCRDPDGKPENSGHRHCPAAPSTSQRKSPWHSGYSPRRR